MTAPNFGYEIILTFGNSPVWVIFEKRTKNYLKLSFGLSLTVPKISRPNFGTVPKGPEVFNAPTLGPWPTVQNFWVFIDFLETLLKLNDY